MLEAGYNLVYIPKHTVAIALSHTKERLFRKELICVGKYKKYCEEGTEEDEKGKFIPFEVEEDTLQHWHKTNKLMQYNGVEVPMPKKHTDDPEFRRGTLVDTELGYNDDKKPAIFGIFKYRDKQAEKDLKNADVSIYVPEKFVDVNGVEYKYPIRHVAFTDYPVIPKLGKIQPIAASFAAEGDAEMAVSNTGFLRKLATKLGLGKEIPDDKLELAIMHVIDAVMNEEDSDEAETEDESEEKDDEEEESEGEVKDDSSEDEEEGNENEEGDDEENDEEMKDDEEETDTLPEKKKKKKQPAALAREAHVKEYHPPAISAGHFTLMNNARKTELDRLVETNCITPAVRDKLEKKYCNKQAIALAFSPQGEELDTFNDLIETLKENSVEQLVQQEASGGQELSLAFSGINAENNILAKNAEERRKKANQG